MELIFFNLFSFREVGCVHILLLGKTRDATVAVAKGAGLSFFLSGCFHQVFHINETHKLWLRNSLTSSLIVKFHCNAVVLNGLSALVPITAFCITLNFDNPSKHELNDLSAILLVSSITGQGLIGSNLSDFIAKTPELLPEALLDTTIIHVLHFEVEYLFLLQGHQSPMVMWEMAQKALSSWNLRLLKLYNKFPRENNSKTLFMPNHYNFNQWKQSHRESSKVLHTLSLWYTRGNWKSNTAIYSWGPLSLVMTWKMWCPEVFFQFGS